VSGASLCTGLCLRLEYCGSKVLRFLGAALGIGGVCVGVRGGGGGGGWWWWWWWLQSSSVVVVWSVALFIEARWVRGDTRVARSTPTSEEMCCSVLAVQVQVSTRRTMSERSCGSQVAALIGDWGEWWSGRRFLATFGCIVAHISVD